MEGVEVQPHIRLSPEQMRPVVIVVGDPARAKELAAMCESHEEIAYNREYRSFRCSVRGAEFLVVSHGLGCAGAAVCFQELMKAGAKLIVRAGTAGSLQPESIRQGDVVICYAAAREDGVSRVSAPAGLPAVSNPYVFRVLQESAAAVDEPVKSGMALTDSLFYPSPIVPWNMDQYVKCHVEIVEMEIATLFVLAQIAGVKAGALCCVDGSPLRWNEGDYDPTGARTREGIQRMLKIVVAAAVRLVKEAAWE